MRICEITYPEVLYKRAYSAGGKRQFIQSQSMPERMLLNCSIVSFKQCLRARSLNRNINPSIISYFPCFLSSSSRRVFTMTSNQRLFTLVLPFPFPCLTSSSSSLKRVSSNHLYVSFLDQNSPPPPPHRTEVLEPIIDMAL